MPESPRGLEFACPFCGLRCYAQQSGGPAKVINQGLTAFVAPGETPALVMHKEPACEQFIKLEPDQFLRAKNEADRLRN